MERIFVTAIATVNALANEPETTWQALMESQSGIGPVTRFDTSWLPFHTAAEVKSFNKLNLLNPDEVDILYPASKLALSCTRSVLKQARLLTKQGYSNDHLIPLFLGTIQGDMQAYMQKQHFNQNNQETHSSQVMIDNMLNTNIAYGLLDTIAQRCGLMGLQSLVSNTCASSGYAIATGMEHIRQGLHDKVLCGGVDVTSIGIYSAFCSLRSLAPEKCQPFDQNRQGLVIGEGCGVMLLESERSIAKRHQQPLAELLGYGWSNDAYHLVAPHPDGFGVSHAVRQAVNDAGIKLKDIDCIFAHGTGTPANDAIEAQTFRALFEDNLPPVTAPKASLGHSMGAASVIEAIVAILSLRHQIIPPTVNHEKIDPNCPITVISQKPKQASLNTVLTNSSGFGGANNTLIIKAVES